MKYYVKKSPANLDQVIKKVYKITDVYKRICIKWDCLKENEYDLILVVRSAKNTFDLLSISESKPIPKEVDIFIYSRKESEGHIEFDRNDNRYSYFIYPAKLIGKGEIEIINQQDKNNVITDQSKTFSSTSYMKPKGKLHYSWRLPFPLGNWNKRANLCIVGKSKYSDRDVIHYTIRGNSEKYCIRLTDTSSDIVIPLQYGEFVQFDSQEIDLEKMTFFAWINWRYFKRRKGV